MNFIKNIGTLIESTAQQLQTSGDDIDDDEIELDELSHSKLLELAHEQRQRLNDQRDRMEGYRAAEVAAAGVQTALSSARSENARLAEEVRQWKGECERQAGRATVLQQQLNDHRNSPTPSQSGRMSSDDLSATASAAEAAQKVSVLELEKQQLQSMMQSARDESARIREMMEGLNRELSDVRRSEQVAQRSFQEAQSRVSILQIELERLRQSASDTTAAQNAFESTAHALQETRQALAEQEASMHQLNQKLERALREKDEASRERDQLMKTLDRVSREFAESGSNGSSGDSMAQHRVVELEAEAQQLRAENATLREDVARGASPAQLGEDVSGVDEEELENAKRTIEELRTKLGTTQGHLRETEEQTIQLRTTINQLQTTMHSDATILAQLNQQRDEMQARRQSVEDELHSTRQALATHAAASSTEDAVNAMKAQLELEQNQLALERQRVAELTREVGGLRSQLLSAAGAHSSVDELQRERDEWRTAATEARTELENIQNALNELRESRDTLATEHETCAARISKMQSDIVATTTRHHTETADLDKRRIAAEAQVLELQKRVGDLEAMSAAAVSSKAEALTRLSEQEEHAAQSSAQLEADLQEQLSAAVEREKLRGEGILNALKKEMHANIEEQERLSMLLQRAQTESGVFQTRVADLESQLREAKLREERMQLTAQTTLQHEGAQLRAQVENFRNQILAQQQTIDELMREKQELTGQLVEKEEQYAALYARAQDLEGGYEESEKDVRALRMELEAVTESASRREAEAKLRLSEVEARMEAGEESEEKLSMLESDLKARDQTIAALTEEAASIVEELATARAAVERAEGERGRVVQELEEKHGKSVRELHEELRIIRERLTLSQQQLQTAQDAFVSGDVALGPALVATCRALSRVSRSSAGVVSRQCRVWFRSARQKVETQVAELQAAAQTPAPVNTPRTGGDRMPV